MLLMIIFEFDVQFLINPFHLVQVAQDQVWVMVDYWTVMVADYLAIWTLMESLAMMEQVGFLICLYVL